MANKKTSAGAPKAPGKIELKKLEVAGQINLEIERIHDVRGVKYRELPRRIRKNDIKDMSLTTMRDMLKQLKKPGAGSYVNIAPKGAEKKELVTQAMLRQADVLRRAANRRIANTAKILKQKPVIIKGQRVHPQKANIFQTPDPKKKAFEPLGKFTGKSALGLGRYIYGASRRATEKLDNTLKNNLIKAVLRSGLPSWARYALADRIKSLSVNAVVIIYTTNASVTFEYIYSDEMVAKKLFELFTAFGMGDYNKYMSDPKYNRPHKRYDDIADGLDKVNAAKKYPTTWWNPGKFGAGVRKGADGTMYYSSGDEEKTPWD